MNEELYERLANLIFPDITETIEYLEKKYPERNLREGAEVMRFAPSPTGFLHTGAVYGSLIDKKIANQTNGIFILRIEDTDKKREVEHGVRDLVNEMKEFSIIPDEGVISESEEIGSYGPYKQSDREMIYKICAKELIKKNRAYPCFCTSEDLEKLRQSQESSKIIPGYYGAFARCRTLTVKEQIEKIEAGEKYIIRFRSLGSHLKKISFIDEIRGKIEMAENDADIVIIKSDGLPTYHFAHAVDDHFMRTTIVLRGEEWIPSTALHLELFDALEFKRVKYAHTPTIMKLDNGSKRKLSKRKDPESAVSYFLENGYPKSSLIEYVLTIINSDYEIWRTKNIDKSFDEFEVKLNKLNTSGALFDLVKLNDISKNIIGRMKSDELLENVLNWSKEYDVKSYERYSNDSDFLKKILAIERDNVVKVRKDYINYKDILPNISYFYNDLFEKEEYRYNLEDGKFNLKDVAEILTLYEKIVDLEVDKETWFNQIKELTSSLGYAANMKEYKENENSFKGSIKDVTGFIRVALTKRENSPDIFEIMKVLGLEETKRRLLGGV